MSQAPVAIHAEQINKQIKTNEMSLSILENVNLEIPHGDTTSIVGVSGAGKSSLLSILAGLDSADSGKVQLFGEAFDESNEDQRAALRAKYTGFVFQSFQLLPHVTCYENLLLPLTLLKKGHLIDQIDRWLDQVGLLKRKHSYPSQLSGGEQQRIALARAFSLAPKILFCDEPTGNLDQKTGGKVIDLLFKLNSESNTTLVMVTHDLPLAKQCTHQYRLSEGKLENVSE